MDRWFTSWHRTPTTTIADSTNISPLDFVILKLLASFCIFVFVTFATNTVFALGSTSIVNREQLKFFILIFEQLLWHPL